MRMLLRADYPNGHFGDPALYVWVINRRDAMLFDCGDLSRLSTRQLLRVQRIFLSHCHIDHFFGFDLFLRVHMGSEKTVHIYGPPHTSERVGGKLRGYTWNLIRDQTLEFVVCDLDFEANERRITRFHAKDGFAPSETRAESWNPLAPVIDAGIYQVLSVRIDHRTPSMAYAIEEKPSVLVDPDALDRIGAKPGEWIEKLKSLFLFGGLESEVIQFPMRDGSMAVQNARELAREVLISHQRHKIAYVTDGAASPENRRRLLRIVRGADLLFCETCFVEAEREQADATQHFTAEFIGKLAAEAGVKSLLPIHFSKRYLERPEIVFNELRSGYGGEVLSFPPGARVERR